LEDRSSPDRAAGRASSYLSSSVTAFAVVACLTASVSDIPPLSGESAGAGLAVAELADPPEAFGVPFPPAGPEADFVTLCALSGTWRSTVPAPPEALGA